jgi:hypothetical protein
MKSILFSLLMLPVVVCAQVGHHVELLRGDLRVIKGQTSFNIKFDYDSILVGNTPEKSYLEEKRRAWEAREPGKGDAFVKQWFADRQKRYEPAFIANFEHFCRAKLNDPQATYTLILKTHTMEGGWDVGVSTHSGEISGELWVVETAAPDHVVARVWFKGFQGNVYYIGDFSMTARIASSYVATGKGVGHYVRLKSKKN